MSGCAVPNQLAPNRQHAQILAMVKIVSNLIDCQCFPRRIQRPIWHVGFVLLEGASFLSGWKCCGEEVSTEGCSSVLQLLCTSKTKKFKPEITIDSEKMVFLDRWGLRTASSPPANVFSLIRLKTSTPKVRRSQRNGHCQPANESGHGPKICCYRSQTRFSQTIERVWLVYPLWKCTCNILQSYTKPEKLSKLHTIVTRNPFYITSTTSFALQGCKNDKRCSGSQGSQGSQGSGAQSGSANKHV